MSTPIPIKKSTGEFNSPLFMKDLNTPIIYGTFGIFITILCVITLALIFPHSVPTTSITGGKKIENNITIGTIIVTIIFAILAIILIFVTSYFKNFYKPKIHICNHTILYRINYFFQINEQ